MDERPRYRNGVLAYTAKDIHDDVSAGMDPDCLFVSLEKFEAERANNSAVTRRGRAGMSKWKQQDEIVCMPNTVCCATACDDEDARLIVTKHNADIAALEATLDAIREVVPEGDNTKWSSWQMVTKIHEILYPKESTNG